MINETLDSIASFASANLRSGVSGLAVGTGLGALWAYAESYPSKIIKYSVPVVMVLVGDLMHPSRGLNDDFGLLAGVFVGYFAGDRGYDFLRRKIIRLQENRRADKAVKNSLRMKDCLDDSNS